MNLKQKLLVIVSGLILLFSASPVLTFAQIDCNNPASAKEAIQCGECGAAGQPDCTAQPAKSLDSTIASIINILSVLVGIVAVIMLIIGGLRYVTSAGNQESAKGARNTIIYALIGLVIVALAQVIAKFVLTSTTPK